MAGKRSQSQNLKKNTKPKKKNTRKKKKSNSANKKTDIKQQKLQFQPLQKIKEVTENSEAGSKRRPTSSSSKRRSSSAGVHLTETCQKSKMKKILKKNNYNNDDEETKMSGYNADIDSSNKNDNVKSKGKKTLTKRSKKLQGAKKKNKPQKISMKDLKDFDPYKTPCNSSGVKDPIEEDEEGKKSPDSLLKELDNIPSFNPHNYSNVKEYLREYNTYQKTKEVLEEIKERQNAKFYTKTKKAVYSNLEDAYNDFLKGNITHLQYEEFKKIYQKRKSVCELQDKTHKDYVILDKANKQKKTLGDYFSTNTSKMNMEQRKKLRKMMTKDLNFRESKDPLVKDKIGQQKTARKTGVTKPQSIKELETNENISPNQQKMSKGRESDFDSIEELLNN
ncbi:unnamed protein product [Moneuplotes crassus]|uniref:Uncharacterized protein n=1 Tax=Euplotes crassus TaxID=5936 RepID=A0AAD1UGF8_EUPCR|nr:unnamed protein product [Moneuplotes crassus]